MFILDDSFSGIVYYILRTLHLSHFYCWSTEKCPAKTIYSNMPISVYVSKTVRNIQSLLKIKSQYEYITLNHFEKIFIKACLFFNWAAYTSIWLNDFSFINIHAYIVFMVMWRSIFSKSLPSTMWECKLRFGINFGVHF